MGWEGKLLSQVSREVLIKAVIQAIPTYVMGCYKLPLGLCNEIEVMVKKFGRDNGVIKGKFIGYDGKS